MSIEAVREYLKQWGKDKEILEFEASSATVALAAKALGVKGQRIAKTLAFKKGEEALLVVTAGDTKIDNKKFKETFGIKAKMLSKEETFNFTGHVVGGVCPFGLAKAIPVYLDQSLRRFETVFPACGNSHSAIEVTLDELETYSKSEAWVDVCKIIEEE